VIGSATSATSTSPPAGERRERPRGPSPAASQRRAHRRAGLNCARSWPAHFSTRWCDVLRATPPTFQQRSQFRPAARRQMPPRTGERHHAGVCRQKFEGLHRWRRACGSPALRWEGMLADPIPRASPTAERRRRCCCGETTAHRGSNRLRMAACPTRCNLKTNRWKGRKTKMARARSQEHAQAKHA
jgi:hypothetical protein